MKLIKKTGGKILSKSKEDKIPADEFYKEFVLQQGLQTGMPGIVVTPIT